VRSKYCSMIFCLAITVIIFSFPCLSQDHSIENPGLWVTLVSPNQPDSLSYSESRTFVNFSQINALTIYTIQLPDTKTGEIIIWEGIYLKDVIRKLLDTEWDHIVQIIIKAPDGYSSVISGLGMEQAESALCTFSTQGKKWLKKYGYMRIIFPDIHEMNWMNNPSELNVILKDFREQPRTWRFLFLDAPVFRIADNKTQTHSIVEILKAMESTSQLFGVFTRDEQLRQYLFDEVAQRMILVPDSTGTWKIKGERVPIGFRLRRIYFLYSGDVGLFTKSLTPPEQLTWQKLFDTIHPLSSQGISASEINVVLTSGKTISSIYLEDYKEGKLSLYQLLEKEKDTQPDIVEIVVSW